MAKGDKIIVRGFSKIGKVVDDHPADSFCVVEFEKIRITVDKKTQSIILPEGCVVIGDVNYVSRETKQEGRSF